MPLGTRWVISLTAAFIAAHDRWTVSLPHGREGVVPVDSLPAHELMLLEFYALAKSKQVRNPFSQSMQ